MPLDAQNIQWPTGTPYLVGDRGTGAWGVKDLTPFIPDVLTGSENFETDPITGAGTWTLTTSSPHSGLRCLRSGVIGNSAQTDYVFVVPVGTNIIRFWHRVSSELNFDFFQVYKDAIIPANLLFQLSGTANVWAQSQFNITGVTTITFRYIKDSSSIGGLDTAFIDDIEWIGTLGSVATFAYEPFHVNLNNCVKVALCDNTVAITGTVDITPLNCATDSVTICPGEDPIPVTFARLDCTTDNIEICNDIGNPVPVSFPRLSCATDSVEICNDAGTPITVSVTNIPHVIVDSLPEVEIKNDSGNPIPVSFTRLDCTTDSVEICNDEGSPITVSATDLDIRNLTCATDKVGACQEGDWTVGIDGTVDVNVIGGTITMVPGKRSLLGLYYATAGPVAYTTAADAANGGDIWLVNTSSSVVVYLRSIRFTVLLDSLAILTNLPTIRLERMTFTGTPSGAQITPAKRDSTDPTNTGTVRTAGTGMTITAGAAIESFSPATADVIGGLLAVNATASIPVEQLFVADLDSYIALRQNEGIVLRQNTAGNATENRQYWANLVWEEI